MQTSTPNTPIYSVRDSWGLLPGAFHRAQSVSVISVYVSSQSWEWHETHKASLSVLWSSAVCPAALCKEQKKQHIFLKNWIWNSCCFFPPKKANKKRDVECSDSLRFEFIDWSKSKHICLFLVLVALCKNKHIAWRKCASRQRVKSGGWYDSNVCTVNMKLLQAAG